MANTLVKDPLFGGPGSGGGGGGVGGSAVQLGVPGTACYESALVRITENWPLYEVVYVSDLALFRVTSPDGKYVYHVQAQCSIGYVAMIYEFVRIPALPTEGA